MYQNYIGKRGDKVKNIVERGLVKRFAEAIGDPHPIFIDEEFGNNSHFGCNIAPPTFPRVFDYGAIKGLHLPAKGLIHGEQSFHYERPLFIGETIYCYSEVKDYYERHGKNGEMGFLVLASSGEEPCGKNIFTSTSVIIITEAVRKGMGL
ncbi:MaoC family dehydratase N-terminal domain-containing protein [Heyndrickxia ginsengihumi]|uniref:Dehydratase n=1 Tax=Heyndrickxia ginsengihumi TaxID=363870 RepID=A0A0A6VHL6_9BACI|nr:MaoC family dehydratase N-terminal domain-containing protein [Heyndrickxia ginsengihumi]KHD86119.1 dehydratase [Heyndrickxia ginsengihumi]MBE6184938.1 MaoC family dehydratase [Bacillus sp. (in: firmicutes)]MCM3023383.1 MaoC family dehydratase N-terminal domain-containing protein [Heyndrickxia ginsengihumi]NEY21320.1 MaoC family dehydratase [Heyndrickxia ginsengihumi]